MRRRDLLRRVEALQARAAVGAAPISAETRQELLREAADLDRRDLPAFAEGARLIARGVELGRGALVPAPMPRDAWERLARDQQRELAEIERRASACLA